MATDKSEPRTGLIAGLALFVIVTLLGLRLFLQSYFIDMSETEVHRKVLDRPTYWVDYMHATEAADNQHLRMPVEQAMAALANGPRPEAIAPRPSTDLAALAGWTQMPRIPGPAAAQPLAPNHTPEPAPATTAAGTMGGSTVTPGESVPGSAFAAVRGDGGYVAPSTEQTAGPPQTTGTAGAAPNGLQQPPRPNTSPIPVTPPRIGPVPQNAPAPAGGPRPGAGTAVHGAVRPAASATGGSTVSPGLTGPSE